jgi:hypothetical protein
MVGENGPGAPFVATTGTACSEVTLKAATIVVLLLVLAFSAFTLLNWSAIVAPTALSVGVTTVHAPLGLILLTGSGLLMATFLVLMAYQQGVALVEARRFARDLHAQRDIADKAEASRFTDLRAYLEGELRVLQAKANTAGVDADALLGRFEQILATRLSEVANGLSAHVAEVEDKLDRVLDARVK